MKKLCIISVLSGLLLAGSSCQRILLVFKGVKKPTAQSEATIQDFLARKWKGECDGVFVIRDSLSYICLTTMIRSIPSVSFFTREGNLLAIRDSGYCPGTAHAFITTLSDPSSVRIDSSFKLKDLSQLISPFGQPDTLSASDASVVLVGFWATFLGDINDNAFGVLEAARKNPAIRCKLYLVNVDILESWGMKQMPTLYTD